MITAYNRHMHSTQNELRIIALCDGRPGHFNKTKALIKSLEPYYKIKDFWWDIKLRSGLLRPLLTLLINRRIWCPSPRKLELFYRSPTFPQHPPDLIISAGGNTLYANALLAQAFACPNVFIGSIRKLKPNLFWRVITHKDLTPTPPYLHWPITLVDIDVHEIKTKGAKLIRENGLETQKLWALLLGGDGGGYRYRPRDITDLARMMALAHQIHGVRWLIVSSRRTGEKNENQLKSLLDPEWVAVTSWCSEQGSSHYHAMLGAAERIVCTEDSHMMLTEAIATGKPVLSVRPESATPTNTDFLPQYVKNGYISRQTIAEAAEEGTTWISGEQPHLSVQLEKLGQILSVALSDKSLK